MTKVIAVLFYMSQSSKHIPLYSAGQSNGNVPWKCSNGWLLAAMRVLEISSRAAAKVASALNC